MPIDDDKLINELRKLDPVQPGALRPPAASCGIAIRLGTSSPSYLFAVVRGERAGTEGVRQHLVDRRRPLNGAIALRRDVRR